MEKVLISCKTKYKSFYRIGYESYEFANNWYKTWSKGAAILYNGRSLFDWLY